MELNVLLRGQSNAGLLQRSPDFGTIATDAEKLLGFDGVNNKINLLEKDSDTAANDNTVVGGTAFIGDWISAVNGNWRNGWTNNTLENGLLNFINALPASEKAAPTAIWRWAPTIAYDPIIPCSTLVRCIEPPLPAINPPSRPMSSAITGAIGTPRDSVCACPR